MPDGHDTYPAVIRTGLGRAADTITSLSWVPMRVVSAQREADQGLQFVERRCRIGHLDGLHAHLPGGLEIDPEVVEVDAALRINQGCSMLCGGEG
jgi:hypothetical protein